ncbi:MAG: ABC transporter permease [Saprospiraceae bacterium]
MFQNYLKIAWRILMKSKMYSLLNISGLALGVLCASYIYLYVGNELSYDRFHPLADNIYRVNFSGQLGDQIVNTAQTPSLAGPTFKEQIPGVKNMCRIKPNGSMVIKLDHVSFTETKVYFADSTLFDLFNFPILQGDPMTALKETNTAVITASLAKKYFGQSNPMGQSLIIDNDDLYKITAVIQDLPLNSHIEADMFLSMTSYSDSRVENWGNTNYNTYLLLENGANISHIAESISSIFYKKFAVELRKYLNVDIEEFKKTGNFFYLSLMPISKIHLYSDLEGELGVNGKSTYVYLFSIIGLLILALAIINFINLTTALASKRAKEVGIRKVTGAVKSGLTGQFLGESIFISFLAWVIAIVGSASTLSLFNDLSGKQFGISDLMSVRFIFSSLFIALLSGLLAGIYPALFLASYTPIKVLKGISIASGNKSIFRNGLVVFQFFITTVLLVCSVVVFNQLKYMRDRNMGFDKEQIMTVKNAYLLGQSAKTFKEKLLQQSFVKSVSITNSLTVTNDPNTSSIVKGRIASNENAILAANIFVDEDYVKTMGMKIAQGRDFSSLITGDSTSVLINEELAKSFGYPDHYSEGQELSRMGDQLITYRIIGIIKNFNFGNLRERIRPMVIYPSPYTAYVNIRFDGKDAATLIKNVEATWKSIAADQPFSYTFLDQSFNNLFEADQRLGRIISVFTFISIIIACLGLLGLVTYMAEQRIKEIGVRKVLGAGAFSIVVLLSKDFIRLVMLSFLFAIPVAWYSMNKWLQNFAYRMDLKWWMFAIVVLGALAITFISVSYQAIKAAFANPIKSLRTE